MLLSRSWFTVTRIELRSFAKINLGLSVLGRRPDGYHDIHTTFQAIDLADEILLEEDATLALSVDGPFDIPADESNLALRAARALAERTPGRGARIRLSKKIPPGAGLGGGSSNAAAILMGLDRLWEARTDPGVLYSIARGLGADVPFFLYGGACLGVGRGDDLLPLPDQPEWTVLVVWPGVGLSTKEVYQGLPLSLTRPRILSSMKGFLPVPPERADREAAIPGVAGFASAGPPRGGSAPRGQQVPPCVDNDLEETAFSMMPRLRMLKDRLLESGALAASMSGSGSSVFGLFPSQRGMDKLSSALVGGGTMVFVCRTLSRDAYHLNLFKRPQA